MPKVAQETPADRSERMFSEMQDGVRTFSEEDLDLAIREHSEKLFHAHLELVDATGYRDAAEQEIRKVRARVDAEVRGKAAEKPTEAQVKAQIETHAEVVAAEDDYAWWKIMASKWSSLAGAFEARRRMLQTYVQYLTQIAADNGSERGTQHKLTARNAALARRG